MCLCSVYLANPTFVSNVMEKLCYPNVDQQLEFCKHNAPSFGWNKKLRLAVQNSITRKGCLVLKFMKVRVSIIRVCADSSLFALPSLSLRSLSPFLSLPKTQIGQPQTVIQGRRTKKRNHGFHVPVFVDHNPQISNPEERLNPKPETLTEVLLGSKRRPGSRRYVALGKRSLREPDEPKEELGVQGLEFRV